ncbi:MAG: capsular polysaccharide synthesis protein, partial [Paludibacter sp.]|nr:capsular polysaccharide synthesis protein [Paludibacter sp.]
MSYSKKCIKFRIKIRVSILRFIGWLQSGDIRKKKLQGEMLKAKMLTNYFAKKYLPVVKNVEQKEITVETPETLWQFWDNPAGKTTPEIVKACLASVDKCKENFEHKILNNSTIEHYTDLPDFVMDKFRKGQMDYAHFSDLLRLNLLKNHGGIWLDATGYMTDFIPKYIIDQDFFVFLTGELTHFPYSFMQSCFIRSQKGSFLCEAWYQMSIEYWKK